MLAPKSTHLPRTPRGIRHSAGAAPAERRCARPRARGEEGCGAHEAARLEGREAAELDRRGEALVHRGHRHPAQPRAHRALRRVHDALALAAGEALGDRDGEAEPVGRVPGVQLEVAPRAGGVAQGRHDGVDDGGHEVLQRDGAAAHEKSGGFPVVSD